MDEWTNQEGNCAPHSAAVKEKIGGVGGGSGTDRKTGYTGDASCFGGKAMAS